MMKQLYKIVSKCGKLVILLSFIEGFLQVFGYLLSHDKSIKNFNFNCFIISIILGVVFLLINYIIFCIFDKKISTNEKCIFNKRRFILISFTIFIMWIPVFMSFYPGIFSYDAYRQIPHFQGKNIGTFQPLFHTLILEFFLFIGNKLSGFELGMILYSFFQMIIMSLIFGYTIENINIRIKNKKTRIIIFIILMMFYSIFPLNSVLSISYTKDVLFSGNLLLLIVSLGNIIDGMDNKSNYILLFISSVSIMLFKNSVVNEYIIFTFITLFILKNNKILRNKIFKIEFLSIITYYLVFILLVVVFRPEENYKAEKYNVPLFNLVYTSAYNLEIDNNDKYLFDYFPRKCFKDDLTRYLAYKHNADWSKESLIYCVNNDFSEKKLISVWIKYGLKYPTYYIDSWGNLTLGFWYFLDTTHTDIYGNESDFGGYLSTEFKSNDLFVDVNHESQFKDLKKILKRYVSYNNKTNKFDLRRIIYQPALYVYMIFLTLLYSLKRKEKEEVLLYILLVCCAVATLIGPCIIIRYIYPFMITLPYLLLRKKIKKL